MRDHEPVACVEVSYEPIDRRDAVIAQLRADKALLQAEHAQLKEQIAVIRARNL
jgi:hypothetical protein